MVWGACMDWLTTLGEVGEDLWLGMGMGEWDFQPRTRQEWHIPSSPTSSKGTSRSVSAAFGRAE